MRKYIYGLLLASIFGVACADTGSQINRFQYTGPDGTVTLELRANGTAEFSEAAKRPDGTLWAFKAVSATWRSCENTMGQTDPIHHIPECVLIEVKGADDGRQVAYALQYQFKGEQLREYSESGLGRTLKLVAR